MSDLLRQAFLYYDRDGDGYLSLDDAVVVLRSANVAVDAQDVKYFMNAEFADEGQTVVSFCTGGIRCEKAAIYLREAGLPEVWQLEGGILKYFEETGGAHFQGRCFVFDDREALDATLAPAHPGEPVPAA